MPGRGFESDNEGRRYQFTGHEHDGETEYDYQIIYTWIRGNKFAFISINKGTEIGNWKRINKDLNDSENKEEKKKFEERILNKIKEEL